MTAHVATLLVACQDRKGLVASLAQVLYGHGANILDSDQHTDPVAGMFFQRLRFDLSTLTTDKVSLEHGIKEVGERFAMDWKLAYGNKPRRVAVFCSKQEHCLYDLLIRHRAGELSCEIACVISNHPTAESIAQHFHIPFHHLPVTPETKAQQEAAAVALIEGNHVDLIVLARYMQILSPKVIDRYPFRIINIHPSLLPYHPGPNAYKQAWEEGVRVSGCTAHFVTEQLDAGPVVLQDVFHIRVGEDTLDEVRSRGQALESKVLSQAVQLFLNDQLVVKDKKVIFRPGRLPGSAEG